MQAGLKQLDISLSETDFFITHLHADHFGLVGDLATNSSAIYFNQPEAEKLTNTNRDPWNRMIDYGGLNGFPREELEAALQNHPGYKHGLQSAVPPLTVLKENDIIHCGSYHLKCIETPGHTIGHLCLYEPEKKFLLSGDHILGDITPNIQCWTDDEDPLEAYLRSLDKIYDLDLVMILPGHRRMVKQCHERILELKDHHFKRADEVLRILEKGSQNAYGVASLMQWDIVCDSWEQFPVSQKWFATGEAIAHLRYLEGQGKIIRENVEGITLYSLKTG